METRSGQRNTWSLAPRQLLWKLSDAARQFRERQTLSPSAALGKRGEDLAHRYLRSAGFMVLARNYRPSGGEAEVDIVARDKNITVFVEVKTRTTDEFGSPDRAVDEEKRRHILSAARSYATRAGIPWSNVRFDIISVVMTAHPSITHHQDAFFYGSAKG